MQVVTTQVTSSRRITRDPIVPTSATPSPASFDHKTKPIVVWAALGAGFLALQLYVYSRWIASGMPSQPPLGRHRYRTG